MNNFFIQRSCRTYVLLGVLTFILSDVVFALVWGGDYNKLYITLIALTAVCMGATNCYFYFKNLINSNPKLSGGLVGALTILVVLGSLLFSIAVLLM